MKTSLFPDLGKSYGYFSKAWKVAGRFFQALEIGPLHNKNFLAGNDWWVGPDAFGLEWVTAPTEK
ncbi:MAG: hypothetical protein NTY53_00890 [Kiritimatiellaeota bacterium]|nr:hypothetical protein [Kiritimatiellota bacterium]